MFYIALFAVVSKKLGSARLRGLARVVGYSAGLTLVAGGIGVHKARADMGTKGLQFGEDLASLAPMLQDVKTIRLNNQVVHTSSAVTLEGTEAVLDKYEALCKASLGADAPVWDKIPEIDPKAPPKTDMKMTMLPILRQVQGDKGMVACFVPTENRAATHTERAFQASLQEFQDTGNFGAIGKFRYAYVKASPTGSTVLTVWTDGDFNIKALMPEEGTDAPGTDPGVMMRPENGQRLFTGTVDGIPYHVYAYKTKLNPIEAIKSYDAEMEKAGWLSVANPIFEGMPHTGGEGRAYINGEKGLAGVVTAVTNPDGDTMVGIAEAADGKVHAPTSPAKASNGF